MEYIKIKFGSDFDAVSSGFEKSIEDMFRSMNPIFSMCDRAWNPQMDIYETHEEIVIRAEIAGVNKEDLEVEINSKAVRIRGKRAEMSRNENATYLLAEIQYGCFERILFMPSPIDPEIVSASYLNGFLQIRLAKLPTDVVHKIPISDA
jgi:HSP20 family protein